MDDQRVQEWGGVLPQPPILICFFTFSLYLCLDALRAHSVPRTFSPVAAPPVQVSLLSLHNMSSDKKLQVSNEI